LFRDAGEDFRIILREFREDLAVKHDVLLLQFIDERRVRLEPLCADGRIQADDPELAESFFLSLRPSKEYLPACIKASFAKRSFFERMPRKPLARFSILRRRFAAMTPPLTRAIRKLLFSYFRTREETAQYAVRDRKRYCAALRALCIPHAFALKWFWPGLRATNFPFFVTRTRFV
jgi:hypothetical protein